MVKRLSLFIKQNYGIIILKPIKADVFSRKNINFN